VFWRCILNKWDASNTAPPYFARYIGFRIGSCLHRSVDESVHVNACIIMQSSNDFVLNDAFIDTSVFISPTTHMQHICVSQDRTELLVMSE